LECHGLFETVDTEFTFVDGGRHLHLIVLQVSVEVIVTGTDWSQKETLSLEFLALCMQGGYRLETTEADENVLAVVDVNTRVAVTRLACRQTWSSMVIRMLGSRSVIHSSKTEVKIRNEILPY
jgi:hypothetical protein